MTSYLKTGITGNNEGVSGSDFSSISFGSGDDAQITFASGNLALGSATSDTVTVAGDLVVSGDTVTVNTATLSVEDPLIELARNNSTDDLDIGFYSKYTTTDVEGATTDGTPVFSVMPTITVCTICLRDRNRICHQALR